MDTTKETLRKKMRNERDELDKKQIDEKSALIVKNLILLEEVSNASTIALYLAKNGEVDAKPFFDFLEAQKKKILVPVTKDEIELVEFTSFDELTEGKFKVLEPRIKVKSEVPPDVLIIPGLAFDQDMHRLGYGKGYYDRLLKKVKSIRIGVCFDFQIVEKIPKHEHDEQMDIIVTEKRILYGTKKIV